MLVGNCELLDPEGKLNRLFSWVLLSGLFIYFAGFYFNVTSKQNTLLYLLVFLPTLVLTLLSWREVCSHMKSFFFVGILMLYFTLSSLWVDPELIESGSVVKYGIYLLLLMLGFFFVVQRFPEKLNLVPKLFITCGVGMMLVAAVYYIGKYGGEWFYLISDRRFSTVSLVSFGEKENPINSAALFGLSILGLFFYKSNNVNKKTLPWLVLLGFLFFWMMWVTKSRGPILSLIVTLFLYVITSTQKKMLVSFLLVAVLAVLVVPFYDEIVHRFMQENYRLEIWLGTLEFIQGKLFFGTGLYYSDVAIPYGGAHIATHSHSFMVDALRVGGVVGVSLLSLVLLKTVVIGLKSSQRHIRFYLFWLLFGCLCLLTNGQLLFYRPSISWLLFWSPLLLIIFSTFQGEVYDS